MKSPRLRLFRQTLLNSGLPPTVVQALVEAEAYRRLRLEMLGLLPAGLPTRASPEHQ